MSKMCKKALTVLLAAVMFMALATSALAGTVTFTTQNDIKGIDVTPGSKYTNTDLFDGFKDVMPGDTKTETITIENGRTDYDYIKVYLSVVPHSEGVNNDDGTLKSGNPLTYDEKYEFDDGKDQSGTRDDNQCDETLESMQDFLNQLTMDIYTGTGNDKKPVAENVIPGEKLTGEPLYLFKIDKNKSATLTVELKVPLAMDNRYAYRVGEVDWVFTVEGGNNGGGGGDGGDTTDSITVKKSWSGDNETERPASIKVQLINKKNNKVQATVELNKQNNWTYSWTGLTNGKWTVEEVDVPEGYTMTTSKTGDVVTITNSKGGGGGPEDPKDPNPPDGGGETPGGGGETPGGGTDTPGGSTGSALTVVKAWEDSDASRRPTAVCVTLFNGDEAVESVWLSAWNNWTYSWTDLGSGLWSVIETEIPAGYTPTYANVDGVVVITNVETLIKTGQVNWPVLALGGAGALMMLAGVLMLAGKKRQNAR